MSHGIFDYEFMTHGKAPQPSQSWMILLPGTARSSVFPVLGCTSQMHPATFQSVNKPQTLYWEILVLTWPINRTILVACTLPWREHW